VTAPHAALPPPRRPAVASHRWRGTATALSSLVHGDETLGTTTTFRRERIVQPDGRIEEVPVVSGNALRGLLRRRAADLLWEALGHPPLPLAVQALLWSGGALAKRRSTAGGPAAVLSGAQLASVRALIPHLAVFGGAGGGRLLRGALAVGKLLPICAETAHLLPADQRAGGPVPAIDELLQVEEYARVDDGVDGGLQPPGDDPATAAAGEGGLQLRYAVETLAAGTQFSVWLALTGVTAAQHAFFCEALQRWQADAHVGGRTRIGHGRLAVHLTSQVVDVQPGSDHDADWRAALTADRARALELLAQLH
jgi:RAMP superfamily